ncbi:hypothetical protein EDD17DRAFT_1898659 [Pisolithus thermaeus]|nr:hypothetical protein EDD17DRAFT_1898659 [Pisolithus thermaeus]
MAGTSCNPRSQRKKHHQSGSGRLYGEDEEDGYLLNTLMLTTTVRCTYVWAPPTSDTGTHGGYCGGLDKNRVTKLGGDWHSAAKGNRARTTDIHGCNECPTRQRTSSTPTNDHIHTRIEDHEEFKNVVDLYVLVDSAVDMRGVVSLVYKCSWFGVECYDSQGHASATAAAVLHLDAQDIVDRCGTAKRFRRSPVEKWRFLSQEHPAAGWSVKLCLTDSEGSSSVKLPPCELWQTFLELAVLVTWSDDFPSHCGSSHRADVEHQQSCAKYTDNLTRG